MFMNRHATPIQFDQFQLLMNTSNGHIPEINTHAPPMYPIMDVPGFMHSDFGHQQFLSASAPTTPTSNPYALSPKAFHPYPRQEKTGRWTPEEHAVFLEGIAKYGKSWKDIATLIPSRTVVQIRTHAQKYFQRLEKSRKQATSDLNERNRTRNSSTETVEDCLDTPRTMARSYETTNKRQYIRRASMPEIPLVNSFKKESTLSKSKDVIHETSEVDIKSSGRISEEISPKPVDSDKVNETTFDMDALDCLDEMDPLLSLEDMQYFCKEDYDCLKIPILHLEPSHDFPIDGHEINEKRKSCVKLETEEETDAVLEECMQSLISNPLML